MHELKCQNIISYMTNAIEDDNKSKKKKPIKLRLSTNKVWG